MLRRILLLLPLALAACVETGPTQPGPVIDPMPVNACGALDLQFLVGERASVLETMRFSQQVRVIRPGQAVTMDYSPARLNIEVNGAERISRVTCG